MRQELVDLFFTIAEHHSDEIPPEHIYRATAQSLGIDASGVPYSGFRYATGRDIRNVDWPRVYDLIMRLWPGNPIPLPHPRRECDPKPRQSRPEAL